MTLKIVINHMIPGCFKPSRKIRRAIDRTRKTQQPSTGHQRLSVHDLSDPGSPLSAMDLSSNSVIGSSLHVFTLSELRVITGDFSSANFLGEGGFGPVHKGFIDDRARPGLAAQPVAVKRLNLDGDQGHREWLVEVIILAQLKNPHLVKLIGYCWEAEDRLLVYEYMTRGSLENHLFRRHSTCLPWMTRIRIALGAAKGLAFLHEQEQPVIYRDFKASNILLDSDYTAKLSDFGLAKDGPEGDETHVSTRIMGTHGYAAPEYLMTGHLTSLSDVYSFGVVLLEIVTGRRAMDKKRPRREQNLVEWAKPLLRDSHKLERIMDPRLEGEYSTEGAKRVAALAYQCLSHHPKFRPTMKDVVKRLEHVLELRDMPSGPFVYITPFDSQNDVIKVKTKEGEAKEVEMEKSCSEDVPKVAAQKQEKRHRQDNLYARQHK
ncbi:unnamed protein product [Cuscuta epithymum]|uniref:non-specific serine/threonine protein kinase n=2 Tax=Cuscuta epithymum TaxID=186058 RepID=A0AAV0F450_9ASTE|nr:unnamed protein product [Cuscuta epithymum]